MAGCCEHVNEPASSGQAGEAWKPAESNSAVLEMAEYSLFKNGRSRVTEAATAAVATTALQH